MKRNLKTIIYIALVAMLLEGCSNMNEWAPDIKQDASILLSESLQGSWGQFTTYSSAGAQVWKIDQSYAVMTGRENQVNYANEDWLISPAVDLTQATAACLTFDHVVRYFEDELAQSATVWVSDNYTSGDPAAAAWTQLTTRPFVDYRSWNFFSAGEVSLTAWVGKQVHIGFKYLSTEKNAGTWEIRNVRVLNREAQAEGAVQDGSEKAPFSVEEAIRMQNTPGCWVEGYIVGYISSGNQYVFNADTCTQATNILIAASSTDNIYEALSMPVQLPAGVVRNTLNLKDHKENLHKKVKLYGNLATYFNVRGLRDVSYFELEDGTTGGNKPIDVSNAIFFEPFTASLGQFTTYSVAGAENWVYNTQFKCAYITGYVGGQSRANEDWLISPTIDLTGKSGATLTFDQALRYNATPAQDATVWYSENYTSGDPAAATWVQLPTAFQDGTTWDFVNVGTIPLDGAIDRKVKIALVYKATDARAGTWEVRNFMVK